LKQELNSPGQRALIGRPYTLGSVFSELVKDIKKQYLLIFMVLPMFLVILIFHYFPIYGVQIAFKDYKASLGITGSPWIGLKHFEAFLSNPFAFRTIKNTVLLSLYGLLWGFPAPIVLAILINEIKNKFFKRMVQTVSYLPYFLSTVIIVGMLKNFASLSGLFNQFVARLGHESIHFFGRPEWFRTLYIGSGIWQGVGWGTIIYLAALTGVNTELYDAAAIDGANRFQRIWHISLPAILPTICILLILNTGSILSANFEKVLLMYNANTYRTADVISTYVYREGIENAKISYTSAVGLFSSVVSFILLFITNSVSERLSGNSLW
jgi:putative aldouronate transport system permease protein